jgi:hypothetical protein
MYYKTRQLEIKAEYCGGNFSSSPGEFAPRVAVGAGQDFRGGEDAPRDPEKLKS